jgi:O-Antigen ligase
VESTTLSPRQLPRRVPERLSPRDRAALVLEVLASPGLAGWLLGLLIVAIAYAAFASGAIDLHEQGRLQVGIAGLLLVAGAGLAARKLALPGPEAELGWIGVGLLGGFAAWSALSSAWSVLPDGTWLAANRAFVYTVVAALALTLGAAMPRSPRIVALSLAALAGLVAMYALAGKLVPEIHVLGIDFDHTSTFSRLRAPLEYWNALGMFCVLGVPVCTWLAAEPGRPMGLRLVAVIVLSLLVVCAGFTYSRGAFIALAVATAVMVSAGPDRLVRLGAVLFALAAAVPPLWFGLSSHRLTTDNLPASSRAVAGLILLIVLAASLMVLRLAWRAVVNKQEEGRLTFRVERRAWRLLTASVAVVAVVALFAAAGSHRGLGGTVSHQVNEFTKAKGSRVTDPGRLFSTTASNRWIWWGEALGAFSGKPIQGWGAGSFPATHLLYRHNRLEVRQPHSVPLQFLAETGLIGAALALGGLFALGLAAFDRLRLSSGRDRSARLALIAAATAWAVHGFYDWDWDIPAVTLPALVALGVAAAPPLRPSGRRSQSLSGAPRLTVAAVVAVAAVLLAVSALRPTLADDHRLDALSKAEAAGRSAAGLERAASEAALAARLDPSGVDPLFAQATVAIRRGRLREAFALLAKAARLQPQNPRVWRRLLQFQLGVGETRLVGTSLRRLARLDPLGGDATTVAGLALLVTSPYRSPTATGTPLPPLPRTPGRAAPKPTPTPTPTGPAAPAPAATRPAPAAPRPAPRPAPKPPPRRLTLPPG